MRRPTLAPPPGPWHNHYRPVPQGPWRGWLDAMFADRLPPALSADPGALLREPTVQIMRRGRNLTLRIALETQPVWIKVFGSAAKGCPRSAVHKLDRAWRAALALLNSGVSTPRPLAALIAAHPATRPTAMMVFEEVADNHTLAALLATTTPFTRRMVFISLARFVRRFHEQGFRHRDLNSRNILVQQYGEQLTWWLVDINRVRRFRRLAQIHRLRDLERLPMTALDIDAFFSAYSDDPAGDAALFKARFAFRQRLARMPRPVRRLWYYWWEIRTFQRVLPLLPGD